MTESILERMVHKLVNEILSTFLELLHEVSHNQPISELLVSQNGITGINLPFFEGCE